MDIVNNSLKHDQPKVTPGNGKKTKEDAMQAQGEVKPGKTVKPKKKNEDKLRRKLPDEAYKMGCWICGGEHRREMCDAEKSAMLCNICGKEASHVTAVCLQQFAGATAAGQPPGRPSTPGFQSGMVAMEERRYKKRSYAQVAGGSALGAAALSPPSPPRPPPSPLPAPGGQLESSVETAEPAAGGDPEGSTAAHDAYASAAAVTADRAASSRPKLLVEVASSVASTVIVALADTGASTTLVTRAVAERIRLVIRDSEIELTGLNGKASIIGEATVGLRVSGVDKKLQTRVIVV